MVSHLQQMAPVLTMAQMGVCVCTCILFRVPLAWFGFKGTPKGKLTHLGDPISKEKHTQTSICLNLLEKLNMFP